MLDQSGGLVDNYVRLANHATCTVHSTLFLDLGTRTGEGSASRPGRFLPPGKTRYPFLQEAGWATGPVWTAGNLAPPTGIRSPDRPARSQSVY